MLNLSDCGMWLHFLIRIILHSHTHTLKKVYLCIYIYKYAFRALLLLSRTSPHQSDSDAEKHVRAGGQNSLQLSSANSAVTSPFLQLPH